MATAKPNMGVGSSSSEHHAGDSSLAAEAGESSIGDPTPLSPTGSTAFGCPSYGSTPAGAEGEALTPHTPEPTADGGEPPSTSDGSGACSEYEMGHGHYFTKKTFHKPTYCHHCTDMLWGLIGQGYICEGTTQSYRIQKLLIRLKQYTHTLMYNSDVTCDRTKRRFTT